MNRYAHVIWDWNGTLLDDAWLCLEVINSLLREHGLAAVSAARYQWIFGFPLEEYCRKLGFDLDRAAYERLNDAFSVLYERRRTECGLRCAAVEALERIQRFGVRQSVLSAYSQELLVELIDELRLSRFFEAVVGVDNPYGLGKAKRGCGRVTELGCQPHSVLLVGDTLHDREVALTMGVDHVLIPSGHQHRQRLAASGSRVLPDLREVAALVTGDNPDR